MVKERRRALLIPRVVQAFNELPHVLFIEDVTTCSTYESVLPHNLLVDEVIVDVAGDY